MYTTHQSTVTKRKEACYDLFEAHRWRRRAHYCATEGNTGHTSSRL